MINTGYLYIVYGSDRYFRQAVISAESLKRVDPEAHVTIITDNDKKADCFDEYMDIVEPLEKRDQVFEKKFWNISRSPYQRTFLVDTDTYFIANCRGIFSLLDFYDFAITPANAPVEIMGPDEPYDRIEGLVPYNSGIMLFRKTDLVREVFSNTYKNFLERRSIHRTKRMDVYFTYTLAMSRVKVYSLPNRYNMRIGSKQALNGEVKILHAAGQGFLSRQDYDSLANEVNKRLGGRYWHETGWRLVNGI